jgi:hypothetical protein
MVEKTPYPAGSAGVERTRNHVSPPITCSSLVLRIQHPPSSGCKWLRHRRFLSYP